MCNPQSLDRDSSSKTDSKRHIPLLAALAWTVLGSRYLFPAILLLPCTVWRYSDAGRGVAAVRHVRLSHAFTRARGMILAVDLATSDLHAAFLHQYTWSFGQYCKAGLDSGKSRSSGAIHAAT